MTDEPILPPPPRERDPAPEEAKEKPATGPRARLRNVARRLMEDETAVSARELLGALVSTSDKAKTELVRAVGREVRAYLEGLGTTELLEALVNDYELEVSAKFRLRAIQKDPDPNADKKPQAD
jgi:hypothetical protein